jgi:cell division protein FtsN
MSDFDRGAYAPPTEAPLAFDARQPVRGTRPAPLTLIISTLVLLALAAAIVMFYRSGVRQTGEAPRAIGTPVGDLKSAAPAEAQPADPAEGLQIYKSESGEPAEGQPQFAPPPEEPQPRPAPVAVVPATPAPKAAPTSPVVSAPTSAGLKPAQPAPTPAPKAAPLPAPKAAVTPPPKAATPAPKPAPAPTPAPKAAPVAAGGAASVQIGAFSSQALADSNWAAAVQAPGGAGKGKHVELVPGKGLYRTTVTGFGSKADAAAFCNALKASGKSCFVK